MTTNLEVQKNSKNSHKAHAITGKTVYICLKKQIAVKELCYRTIAIYHYLINAKEYSILITAP